MSGYKSDLLIQNYKSLYSAFKSFEDSILEENKKLSVITQNFLRFSEILINIYFRIVESGLYGNLSASEEECINRMIAKNVVSPSRNWEVFLMIKNQLQNPDKKDEYEVIFDSISSIIIEFSDQIMLSIQSYLEKESLYKKTD